MSRARVLGALLAVILLACGTVIYLDQQGTFGEKPATANGTTTDPSTPNQTVPTQAPAPGDPGYGDLK